MADLTFANGKILAEPRCPVHGQMRLDFPTDTWVCRGWDGEGCDHAVRMEDADWIPVQDIRITGVTWQT